MPRYRVAPAAGVPPGGRLLVEAGGKRIVVFNLGGDYFALLNRCPHQGGALCQGTAVGLVEADPADPGQVRYGRLGEIIRCPWHGWEFDIRTGLSCAEPGKLRTRSYPAGVVQETLSVPVKADGGDIFVEV